MSQVSPLAPERFPAMPAVAGVRLAAAACGVRYRGRDDVLYVELAEGTTVAGAFTKSETRSAPVDWCRKALVGGTARAVVVNAGNANAFTGQAGVAAVERTVQAAADLLACRPSRVFVASTGVIGEPLPVERIVGALPALRDGLGDDGWEAGARAIMTTDTFPKGATRRVRLGGAEVTVNGIAKGGGMIGPNMATALAFVFTDATIPASVLQELMGGAIERTFNCVTVDGDTSTSDTALLFATGAGPEHPPVTSAKDPQVQDFRTAVEEVMLDLAQQLARDGEGASKFVAITVSGAETDAAARRIAFSIAQSPLVKTAIAGEDPNWGRIVMAIGKAGEAVDRDRTSIRIGGIPVAADGGPVEGYDEAPVALHMKGREILVDVDVAVGGGRATVWTCDLTHDYIAINADYRS